MPTLPITLVKIYSREKEHQLQKVLRMLHDDHRVMGATILRGVQGFGLDGVMHDTHLVDLSFDLPLILEFFDQPDRIEDILRDLETHMTFHGVISIGASLHQKD